MIGLSGESRMGLENGIRYLERSHDERSHDELSAESSQENECH